MRHGVILLDEAEIIFRIYETTDREWKFFHYHSSRFSTELIKINDILEIIRDFLQLTTHNTLQNGKYSVGTIRINYSENYHKH